MSAPIPMIFDNAFFANPQHDTLYTDMIREARRPGTVSKCIRPNRQTETPDTSRLDQINITRKRLQQATLVN